MAKQTMHLADLVTKCGSGISVGMMHTDISEDNTVGGPHHQGSGRSPTQDAPDQWWHRDYLWQPCSLSVRAGSLLGCCRPTAAQTVLSAALAIKFGSRIPVEMLLADGGEHIAVDCPGHPVW